jgi:hypothetical protein
MTQRSVPLCHESPLLVVFPSLEDTFRFIIIVTTTFIVLYLSNHLSLYLTAQE